MGCPICRMAGKLGSRRRLREVFLGVCRGNGREDLADALEDADWQRAEFELGHPHPVGDYPLSWDAGREARVPGIEVSGSLAVGDLLFTIRGELGCASDPEALALGIVDCPWSELAGGRAFLVAVGMEAHRLDLVALARLAARRAGEVARRAEREEWAVPGRGAYVRELGRMAADPGYSGRRLLWAGWEGLEGRLSFKRRIR